MTPLIGLLTASLVAGLNRNDVTEGLAEAFPSLAVPDLFEENRNRGCQLAQRADLNVQAA